LDFDKLNNEQRELVDSVFKAVHRGDPAQNRYFYVDAPGSSGKTFVFNMIAMYL